MKKKFLILTVLFCALAAPMLYAQETVKNKMIKTDHGGAELLVPEQECRHLLIEHKPSADTEYKPGVDIHGKPVMEADLTPSVVRPPEKYSFDITVDIAQYMGLTVPEGVKGEATVGTVTIEKGQVSFNGTPLEGDAVAALKTICQAQRIEKALSKPQKPLPKK